MGVTLERGHQTFKLLNPKARWIKFSEWVDIKNKLNLKKIGGTKMGSPQTGPSKI